MKFYVLEVVQDIEPQLHGPYKTEAARDRKAIALRASDGQRENGIFALDVNGRESAEVNSYSGNFLDGKYRRRK